MKEMNEGNVLFGQSCHLDHQPGRTKEFTTFEGVAYDPEHIMTLFTFHMKGESEHHVAVALSWLQDDEALFW